MNNSQIDLCSSQIDLCSSQIDHYFSQTDSSALQPTSTTPNRLKGLPDSNQLQDARLRKHDSRSTQSRGHAP